MITTVALNPATDSLYDANHLKPHPKYFAENMDLSTRGKGIYVAEIASILGGKVNAIGFLGKISGRQIQKKLEQLGIHNSFVWINESLEKDRAIAEPFERPKMATKNPIISKEELNAFVKTFIKTLKHSQIITVSGSMPEGLPQTIYRDMVKIAQNNNVKLIIHTCGKCLEKVIQAKPFMIQSNIRELEKFAGYPLSSEYEIIFESKHICKQGIDIVAISLGEKGAIFTVKESGIYKVYGPRISLNGTVGYEDAFLAGFIVSLYENNDLEQAFKAAVAAGTANALEREIGQLTRKAVIDLYAQIHMLKYDWKDWMNHSALFL